MSGIDALTAAKLSQAAYTPLTDYENGNGPILPTGWSVDVNHSGTSPDLTNQFITFVNTTTHQVVIAFKGSDNASNFSSDLSNNGASAYANIQASATIDLTDSVGGIRQVYSGYSIMTDGHSLGGGMAATFAVQNNLDGYGQNALPIAAGSMSSDPSFNSELTTWNNAGRTFSDTVVAGDPATLYYNAQITNNSGDKYVGSATLLQNPNLSSEIDAFSKVGVNVSANIDAGYYALNAHSIATVVSLEQAGGATTSGSATAPLNSNLSALSADFVDVALDAPNGSGNASSTILTGGTNDPFSTATITLLSSSQTQVTANLKTGTSFNDILTNNADGSVGNVANGYSGLNLSGTNIWQETDTTSSGGAISASITGAGDVASLSNASISFAANAVATVTGNADTIAGAAGAAVTISGTGNVCSASNVTITLTDGAQCTVTGSHDTIILGNNVSVVIDSLASYDVTTVTGSHSTIADNGASDYDVLQGAFDTATATGAGAGVNITGDNDNATLSGANGQAGASGASDYIVLAGAYETDTLSGANDASLATGNNDQIAFMSTATNAQGGAYGNNDYISMAGLGDVATLTGIGDSALETGVNEQLVFSSTASNALAGAYGNNDYISLQGTGDHATLTGTNDSAYAYGSYDILTFTATAAYANVGASGASDYLVLQGNNDQATLIGSGEAANASGNYDTLTFTSTAANGQAAASGLSNIINFSGLSDIATMTGVGDTANLSGAYNHATGTGNTETINMDGLSDIGSLTGMYEAVNSTRTGETINLSASNGSWDSVYGSGDQLNLDTQVAVVLNGSTDHIAGAYDLMRFSGQYNILNTNYSVINDFNATGDYLTGWYDVYNGGNPGGFYNGPDPIVLNLDGEKVETVGITNSNAFFDVGNNGQKILTGWAAAGEGLLMYDPKNTNKVTGEASLVSSFAELAALDDNRDGVLNSQDTTWSQLKVWVDKAGIGSFDSESLFSLDKLGITSINLKASQASQDSNGNTIVADSTFTWKDGRTGDIAGVTFATAPDVTMGVNDEHAVEAHAAYTKLVSAMATGDASQIAAAQREFNATTSSLQGTAGATTADTAPTEPNDKLSTGNGAANTYVLSETSVNVVKDTAAGLNGKTIQNFSTLDGIDLTTLGFGENSTLGFSEDASKTYGTLTVSDGAHAASLLLLGQYSAASFQTVSDGGTGTLVAMAGTANLPAILAAAHG